MILSYTASYMSPKGEQRSMQFNYQGRGPGGAVSLKEYWGISKSLVKRSWSLSGEDYVSLSLTLSITTGD